MLSLPFFTALPFELQLAAVYDSAQFVMTRWEGTYAVNLYYFPDQTTGYFIELYYCPDLNAVTQLRSFYSSKYLEEYAAVMKLPG